MKIKFSIITTTYNRAEQLSRAINSLLSQDYTDWEMIIVNDSANFQQNQKYKEITMDEEYKEITRNEEYKEVEEVIKNNTKFKYIINKQNIGSNKSKNIALEYIADDSNYIIFLDDDDWLAHNALVDIQNFIIKNNNPIWIISNRYNNITHNSLTKNKTNKKEINYLKDYLIYKNFTGDATHIIKTNTIKQKNNVKIQFSNYIKNAEEWFFFSQINYNFLYFDHNSTLTEGYLNNGLTNNYTNKIEKIKNTYYLLIECIKNKNINFNIIYIKNYLIILYFILRLGAIIVKR